jgi:RsiW-degrading membrane proteinase PrsW (M82 family)
MNVFAGQANSTIACPYCHRTVALPAAQPQAPVPAVPDQQVYGQDNAGRECIQPDHGPDVPDMCSKFSIGCLAVIIIVLFIVVWQYGVLFVLAIIPACFLFWWCYTRADRQSVRFNPIIRTFLLGVIGAIPIAIIEAIIVAAWVAAGGVDTNADDGQGDSTNHKGTDPATAIGAALFMAFLVAGLCEETLKYVLVRRMYNRPIYSLPRGLVIVGLAGALGFATIENIAYVLSFGWLTALIRAVVSVPLHSLTGLIIGTKLARHKFFPQPGQPTIDQHFKLYVSIIWLPILLHGLFNFPIMAVSFANPENKNWYWVQICPVIVVIVAYFLYRRFSKELAPAAEPAENEQLQAAGGGRGGNNYTALPQDHPDHPDNSQHGVHRGSEPEPVGAFNV